jgi:hypothetical protein
LGSMGSVAEAGASRPRTRVRKLIVTPLRDGT